jgi:hypothetical protein
MSELATESILAAGYGLFLALCALGLDALARHSHRRAERYRTGGFTYLESHDAWDCPEGERLHRVETDRQLRLARYRARAHVCNACRLKDACTDSDEGREVVRALDPWPHSEAGRFHRGIALAMVGFALLVICAGAGLNHGAADLAVLGAALLLSTLIGIHLLADLRSAPSGFPWPTGERSGPAPHPGRSASS